MSHRVMDQESPTDKHGRCANLCSLSTEYHPFLINTFRHPALERAFLNSFYGEKSALYLAVTHFVGTFLYLQFFTDDMDARIEWMYSVFPISGYFFVAAILFLIPSFVRHKLLLESFVGVGVALGSIRFALRSLDYEALETPIKTAVFYFDICFVIIVRPRAIVAAVAEAFSGLAFAIGATIYGIPHTDPRLVASILTYWVFGVLVVLFLAAVNRTSREVFLMNLRLASSRASLAAANADRGVLLRNILPKSFVKDIVRLHTSSDSLASPHLVFTRSYVAGGLLQTDIVGFTRFTATNHPDVVTRVLNLHYSFCDSLTSHRSFGCIEKVKTVGDSFIAFASNDDVNDDDEQEEEEQVRDMSAIVRLVALALSFVESVRIVNRVTLAEPKLALRIGIAKGDFVAVVHGDPSKRIAFDVFGQLTKELDWLESTAPVDGIQVNESVVSELLQSKNSYFKGMVTREEEGVGVFEFPDVGLGLGEDGLFSDPDLDFECLRFVNNEKLGFLLQRLLRRCEKVFCRSFSRSHTIATGISSISGSSKRVKRGFSSANLSSSAGSSFASASSNSFSDSFHSSQSSSTLNTDEEGESGDDGVGGEERGPTSRSKNLQFLGNMLRKHRYSPSYLASNPLPMVEAETSLPRERRDSSDVERLYSGDLDGGIEESVESVVSVTRFCCCMKVGKKWSCEAVSSKGFIYPLLCFRTLRDEIECYRRSFERAEFANRLLFPSWALYNLALIVGSLFTQDPTATIANVVSSALFICSCVAFVLNIASAVVVLTVPKMASKMFVFFMILLCLNVAVLKAQQSLLFITGFGQFNVNYCVMYAYLSLYVLVYDCSLPFLFKILLWLSDYALIWGVTLYSATDLGDVFASQLQVNIVLFITVLLGSTFKEYNVKMAYNLFCIAKSQVAALRVNKAKNEKLIASFLPEQVAMELIDRKFRSFSTRVRGVVCFVQVDPFDSTQEGAIRDISTLFSSFDILVESRGFLPIKKHGSVYLFMSSRDDAAEVNDDNKTPPEDDESMTTFYRLNLITSLEILDEMVAMFEDKKTSDAFTGQVTEAMNLKIGLAMGSFGTGLLGLRRYVWDVFGDIVNLSARLMQVVSNRNQVIVSAENAQSALSSRILTQNLGSHRLKGKGEVECLAVSLRGELDDEEGTIDVGGGRGE